MREHAQNGCHTLMCSHVSTHTERNHPHLLRFPKVALRKTHQYDTAQIIHNAANMLQSRALPATLCMQAGSKLGRVARVAHGARVRFATSLTTKTDRHATYYCTIINKIILIINNNNKHTATTSKKKGGRGKWQHHAPCTIAHTAQHTPRHLTVSAPQGGYNLCAFQRQSVKRSPA